MKLADRHVEAANFVVMLVDELRESAGDDPRAVKVLLATSERHARLVVEARVRLSEVIAAGENDEAAAKLAAVLASRMLAVGVSATCDCPACLDVEEEVSW